MKLIRTVAMLGLSCGLVAGFPASSPRTAVVETFAGGADPFDLNLHSLTLVPYESGSNQNQFRYPSYYNVRPIRNLPVDMSGATPVIPTLGNYPVVPISGLPTIHGIPLNGFQITIAGEVILKSSNPTSSVTLKVLKSSSLGNSSGILKLEASYLKTTDGRLAIQFDYSLDPEYLVNDLNAAAKPLARNTFQVEVFPDGMIRYSYFSVDVTAAEVGISSTTSSSTGGDQDFSASILKTSDLVRNENSGNAGVALQLDANVSADFNFQYATRSGTALSPSDHVSTSGAAVIASGSRSATVLVPVVNDTLGETTEYFDLVVHAPSKPDWIFAEPRIWILDDDAPASGAGPRIDLSGNRVFVLPPDPSSVIITGFRLLSLSGGTLLNSRGQASIQPNTVFSLEAGAAGLIASGPGIHFTVEAIHSGGTSMPVGFDLDGSNASPVFNLTSDTTETTEGGFASVGVSASHDGASISYQILPVSAQPSADYAPLVKTLEFKDGFAEIEIPVFADGVMEGNEEFLVRLINPSPGSFIGPSSRAKIVIADGEGASLRSPAGQRLPIPAVTGRSVSRHLTTANWRFKGEPFWRPPASHGWNVREGLHQVDFRVNAVTSKLYMAPETYLEQGIYNPVSGFSPVTDLDVAYGGFTPAASPTAGTAAGSLTVNLLPSGVSSFSWRLAGGSTWRGNGFTETSVPEGTQLVEFVDVAGYDKPSIRPVVVRASQVSSVTASYQVQTTGGAAPAAVAEPDLRSTGATWSHIPISTQTGPFKVSFEYKPSANINAWIGLSGGRAIAETDLVAAMRVLTTGIQALDQNSLSSIISPVPVVNQWHFVEFEIDPAAGNYNLHVTNPTGQRVTVRTAAVFRSTVPPTASFSYISMFSNVGTQSVRGISFQAIPAASSWRIIEFPDQTGTFDLALELQVRPFFGSGVISTPDPAPAMPFSFNLTNGRVSSPPGSIGPVNFPLPAFRGATGRYGPVVVRMHVDLASDTYEIRGESATVIQSGSLPQALTTANHLYVSENSPVIAAFRVADTMLPPACAPASGAPAAPNRVHLPIAPQTGRFALTCDIRAVEQNSGSGDRMDALLGLSATKVNLDSEIAVTLRAKVPATGTGSWEAHSGGGYIKEGDLPIVAGRLYHAVFHVDVPARSYRISLAPDDGGPVVILEQGSFRQQATEIRYLTLGSVQGRLEISNVRCPLPHPNDSPAYFTGQIESPNGFGTGTVVADHVVLTSARLVVDPATGNFTSGISWRRSEGGYAGIPDACEPSFILLSAPYSGTLLGTAEGDSHDVALLVFRPLDVPDADNAPGGGCYSGFQVDDGAGSWTSAAVKSFPSFPVSGIAAGDAGKVHSTAMGSVSFTSLGNSLHSATGIKTPPGSEGAAVFVQGADKVFRPAAVCIGSAANGVPRFRTIDAGIAEAIYQANSYQRMPGFLQGYLKGGVYYINPSLATSTSANRVHIISNAIPPAATWSTKRYGTTLVTSPGGQTIVADPGTYQVTFGTAPQGFTGPSPATITKTLTTGTTWNLPAVYTADPPSSYDTWVDTHYDSFEATSPAAAATAQTPWLGIDNLTAYAFGFDPKVGPVRYADIDNGTPGYPRVTINPPNIKVELLQRADSNLVYEIQYSDTASSWSNLGTAHQLDPALNGWRKATWTFTSLPGQPGRKFVRTRVTLTD